MAQTMSDGFHKLTREMPADDIEGCGHCAERTRRGCPPPDTLPCIGCPRVARFRQKPPEAS